MLGEQGKKTAGGRGTLEDEALLNRMLHESMIQRDGFVFNKTVKAHNSWSIGVVEYWSIGSETKNLLTLLFISSSPPLLQGPPKFSEAVNYL